MTLTYDANLDELLEPAARQFLRSETARKYRIQSTIIGGVIWVALAVFAFWGRSVQILAIAAIMGFAIGATLGYFTYAPTIRSRIRKHLERETLGILPVSTVYRFEAQKLVFERLAATLALPLSELKNFSEDGQYLEIDFGKTGLCIIPLRAFENSDKKEAFIQNLKSEPLGMNGNHHQFG